MGTFCLLLFVVSFEIDTHARNLVSEFIVLTLSFSSYWLQQAQTYFAGQSRYVGVYETSRMAARAYVVVQNYLKQYRNRSMTKDAPKEELAKIFATARKAADEAVIALIKEDEKIASGGSARPAAVPVAVAPPAAAAADGSPEPINPEGGTTEKV